MQIKVKAWIDDPEDPKYQIEGYTVKDLHVGAGVAIASKFRYFVYGEILELDEEHHAIKVSVDNGKYKGWITQESVFDSMPRSMLYLFQAKAGEGLVLAEKVKDLPAGEHTI